jgi:hypothetical protein
MLSESKAKSIQFLPDKRDLCFALNLRMQEFQKERFPETFKAALPQQQ